MREQARSMLIAPDRDFRGAPQLRGILRLAEGHGDITSALLRLSAFGLVEAWVGGRQASEDVLIPGWSSYEWRLRFTQTDVTAHVVDAGPDVVVGLALGNGWYRGRLGWTGASQCYGDELAGYAQLTVTFADGHQQEWGTDLSWRAGPSSVLSNDLYDGQSIDARLRGDDWLRVGFDDSAWVGVHEIPLGDISLEPRLSPGVRRQETRPPQRVWTSPAGKVLVDFGQNLVGWVRADITGPAGSVVTVRHAEELENQELATRPLRSAKAKDQFILSGGRDVFEPSLTFHGFRYVEVDGWPGGIEALRRVGGLNAVVVSSHLERTGWFETSNPLLNQFHENVVQSMRGNFVDVPTDCPQRDERLGWTGDIAIFAPSAAFLFDVGDFLRDWLRDLALEQAHTGGVVPLVVPDPLKHMGFSPEFPPSENTAIWSDAAVWIPWALWIAYGERRILEDQWPSMLLHGRTIRNALSANGAWDSGFQFGDWLDPDAPPNAPGQAKADPSVVATACAYRTASIISEAAAIVGDPEAAAEYSDMAAALRNAFSRNYVNSNGQVRSDCATVYALAIAFDILDSAARTRAGDRLVELVSESHYRISTGFAGTPYITDALTQTGHVDTAYRLILQTECPSWLYPVTMDATTIWERWDSKLPDGTINPGEMTSFNHYALGAVVDWLHRVVGGISPLAPGYDRILFAPHADEGITWSRTTLNTRHGTAKIYWEATADQLDVTVTVPPNASAVLELPGMPSEHLKAGTHRRKCPLVRI